MEKILTIGRLITWPYMDYEPGMFMWRGGSRECTLLEGDFRMLLRGRITIVVYKRTGWEE